MRKAMMPMKLQFFAEPGGDGDGGAGNAGADAGAAGTDQSGAGQQTGIDYEKLASIIEGKQSATEDTVLKSYFRQQGLSKEEMASAIQDFKAKKQAQTPNPDALQAQIAQAQKQAQDAVIEKEGILLGVNMGLDAKSIPYILKMADTSAVIGTDGTVDQEKLKEAVNQVLEDIPALKPKAQDAHGFQTVGSDGGGGRKDGDQASVLAGIFGNAK